MRQRFRPVKWVKKTFGKKKNQRRLLLGVGVIIILALGVFLVKSHKEQEALQNKILENQAVIRKTQKDVQELKHDVSEKQKAIEVAKLRNVDVDEGSEYLVQTVNIAGRRYSPKAGVSYGNSQHFYRQYNVPVVQERTSVNAAKAIGATLVTPITLAADGVLLLLGLPLLAVFVMAN